MADSCVEGHRKRAKYLLGDDELGSLFPSSSHCIRRPFALPSELLKRRKTSTANNSSSPPVQAPPPSVPSVVDNFSPTDPLFNPAFDTPPFPFGSEAANLEYSILSAILGNPPPEGNPPSDSHPSSTPPPSTVPFVAPSSEYATSWSGAPNGSLLPSEPSTFLTSPFAGARNALSMYEGTSLALSNADRPRTGSSSSHSTDFLSQSYSSLDPSSSATSSSGHSVQDSSTSARQSVSDPSPSKPSLRPLTPRWPACTTDSAYVLKNLLFFLVPSLSEHH